MNPIGHALRTLRILSGLPLAEIARRASLEERAVRLAEEAEPLPAELLTALSGVYGVDPMRLKERIVAGLDESATLFLFSGDLRDLAADDLEHAASALDRARAHARSDAGRAGVRTRLERLPSAPAGPHPRDAARQGHVLARDLRAALGLDPVQSVDFTAVLARLGVVATSARLTSRTLRAMSVLDRDRAAAAIVLNERGRRSRLRRVALAHEICHLVYDPIGPDGCILTIDALSGPGASPDLRESRARGFAAEFLLPAAGLRALLGPPCGVRSPEEAQRLIDQARACFDTPWEIAVNHLHNLGFHDLGPADQWTPPCADRPIGGRAEQGVTPSSGLSDERAALEHAMVARAAAGQLQRAIREDWHAEAEQLVSGFRDGCRSAPMGAATALAIEMDRAFVAGRAGLVRAVLSSIRPDDVHGDALVGLLAAVRRPCEVFGADLWESYRVLVARTLDALSRTWGWSEDEVAGAKDVLGWA